MLNKIMLKNKVRSLDIPNIPVSERLDLSFDAEKYLIENFKNMTDQEIIKFIQKNYLIYKIGKEIFLTDENLECLMNNLNINKKYNVHEFYYGEQVDYMEKFKNVSPKRLTKFVMLDPHHECNVYVFIYYTSLMEADIYIGRDKFVTDQFE